MDVILENRNKLQAECEDMYKALGAKILELHAAERRFITNQFELCGIITCDIKTTKTLALAYCDLAM